MDEIKHQVQQRFGTYAQNYVSSTVHGSGYTLDRLIELLEPKPGQLALDLATGGGHVALALARRGVNVAASDLTAPMLAAAQTFIRGQHVAANFICLDAQDVPFADNTLDIVTCRLAPHHFPDVTRYVRECVRVVRPGGIVGLVDHAGAADSHVSRYVNAYEKLRDPSHVWEYSQDQWEVMFSDAGLQIKSSELARTRINFNWWTNMQNNDADTVIRLRVMLQQAPATVAAWLEPDLPENGEASFTRWQIILIGVKAG